MKKIYFSIIFSLGITLATLAQEFPNRVESNCNGVRQSAHSILNDGKVLFIVASGFDCTLCQTTAPLLKEFAAKNVEKIAFWGAFSYLYDEKTDPNCSEVLNYEETYGLFEFFNFADIHSYYQKEGLPHYIVVDPATKNVAYKGGDLKEAENAAGELTKSAGLADRKQNFNDSFSAIARDGVLRVNFNAPENGSMTLNLYDITGKEIDSRTINYSSGQNQIAMGSELNLRNGIYILNLRTGDLSLSRKVSMY